ncbi:hypothetical protein DN068_05065 [Taibaiella soli]|uniref:Uncharacterized protein n=1 Tax=Taibaiella soli TaxID=1649169 RepID=A0A2W2AF08_9BACT|nr:hypothetical protein DN068_05065 [Taibaiella soli]
MSHWNCFSKKTKRISAPGTVLDDLRRGFDQINKTFGHQLIDVFCTFVEEIIGITQDLSYRRGDKRTFMVALQHVILTIGGIPP